MPFKLAVAMLIIATVTPIVLNAVDVAEHGMETSESMSEARTLADGVSRAYYGGTGTTVTVSLSLPAGESLAIGGEGGDAYSIRIIIDGEERERVLLQNPSVEILGGEKEISGDAVVYLRCEIDDGAYGVRVLT